MNVDGDMCVLELGVEFFGGNYRCIWVLDFGCGMGIVIYIRFVYNELFDVMVIDIDLFVVEYVFSNNVVLNIIY